VTWQRSLRPVRPIADGMPLDGLAASLQRIEGLQDRSELRFDLPSSGNWQRCSDLLEDPGAL
jgi:hypothetical protein